MELGISGRVAVVTGGSEGIGKGAAESLAAEGVNVVIVARNQDKLDAALPEIQAAATTGQVEAVSCDVGDETAVNAAFKQIVERWGKIDILVNNAGMGNANSFNDLTDDLLGVDLQVKVFGAVHCTRAALPSMRAQKWGRIINITTAAGKAAPGSSVPTSMSRAAGIALTKALSKEFGPDGVLVNTVCIGSVRSGQNDRQAQDAVFRGDVATIEEYYENRGKGAPIGRVGEAREAGDLICFLASERAGFITGTAINFDGGAAPVV